MLPDMQATHARQVMTASILGGILLALTLQPLEASHHTWDDFLVGVRADAVAEGISRETLDEALDGLRPDERVIELDRRQPEGTVTFDEYMAARVPAELIESARSKFARHEPLLVAIAGHYGFDPEYIVAIWAVETRFGGYTGGFDVIASVATLAFDDRRSAFFRKELMHALGILEEGHIARADMKGSWAGAMGQSQFLPSSFNHFAVDWDLDGRRDIWTTRGDVFASIANYLSGSGWKRGMPWGSPVTLPEGFDHSLVDADGTQSLASWLARGVTWAEGAPSVSSDAQASLALPAGIDGPAWLVFDNYRAILRWNRSDYFAMSVTAIADALARR